MNTIIEIDHGKCDKDGLCVKVCLEYVLDQADRNSFPVVTNPEMCIYCGHCVAVCPSDAIKINGIDMANFHPRTAEMAVEPDHLLNFLRERRSIRNYKQKRPVPREMVEKLIEAARYAPTGGNAQSLKHIIIEKREIMDALTLHIIDIFKDKLALCQDEKALAAMDPIEAKHTKEFQVYWEVMLEEYDEGKDPIFLNAPLHVIIYADPSITPCPLEDATLATHQMMLTAHSLGLGTCFASNFHENANNSPAIREILAIPPESKILMGFTLGYPAIRFKRLVDREKPEVKWLT